MSLSIQLLTATALIVTSGHAQEDDAVSENAPTGMLLSAFFGLDESRTIQRRTRPICRRNSGRDGMPVVFSHEVDDGTLDPGDFEISAASGERLQPSCVTLRPADEPGEQRTALLIGQFGGPDDPPMRVAVIGDVMSIDGGLNMRGATVGVTPLDAGPFMVVAETVPRSEWQSGGADNCPIDGLQTMVRVIWAGGVTKPGGDEIDDVERQAYQVAYIDADGDPAVAIPYAIGDLNDNDNNHELCLSVTGELTEVTFAPGLMTDPNEDLNPETTVSIGN